MKKIVIICLLIVILIAGCKGQSKSTKPALSELQVEACNSAHSANTCDTRLAEVGIVLKEDCCRELEKCC